MSSENAPRTVCTPIQEMDFETVSSIHCDVNSKDLSFGIVDAFIKSVSDKKRKSRLIAYHLKLNLRLIRFGVPTAL